MKINSPEKLYFQTDSNEPNDQKKKIRKCIVSIITIYGEAVNTICQLPVTTKCIMELCGLSLNIYALTYSPLQKASNVYIVHAKGYSDGRGRRILVMPGNSSRSQEKAHDQAPVSVLAAFLALHVQSTLVTSTSIISNNRLSRRENLIIVLS